MTFDELILKHQIGPSMNQRYRISIAESRGEIVPPQLYDGYDGRVGDGWVPILDNLFTQLKELGWNGGTDQIKEKFGGLRVYISDNSYPDENTNQIFDLINRAENLSFRTCEECGSNGEVSTKAPDGKYWIRTLCQKCRS